MSMTPETPRYTAFFVSFGGLLVLVKTILPLQIQIYNLHIVAGISQKEMIRRSNVTDWSVRRQNMTSGERTFARRSNVGLASAVRRHVNDVNKTSVICGRFYVND